MSSATFFPTDYTLAACSTSHLGPEPPISPAACRPSMTTALSPRPPFFRRQSSSSTARAEDSPLTPLASAQQPSTAPSIGYFPHKAAAGFNGEHCSSSSLTTVPRSSTSLRGENHDPASLKSTLPSGASKDRRQRYQAPPPIVIAPPQQSTFIFPPSPTEDDVSPPPKHRRYSPIALSQPPSHESHYTIPPSPTPPVSPKADGSELPVVPRPRPQSSQSSLRHSRKASLIDGQLFGAQCGASFGSSPLSSPVLEGAPTGPRRMSVAGAGTRRRSSMGYGHPGSTGYASFTSCINGTSASCRLTQSRRWLCAEHFSSRTGALAHEKKANTYEDSAQGASPKVRLADTS